MFAGALGIEAGKGDHELRFNYRFAAGTQDYRSHNLNLQYRYLF